MTSKCKGQRIQWLRNKYGYPILGILALLFLLDTESMLGNEKTIRVTIQQNGTTIAIEKGDLLEVRLPATLGTGYSWHVIQAGGPLLSLHEKSEGKKRDGEAPKAGGAEDQVFQFDAKSKGTAKLELQYARSWEKQTPPAKTFSLTVTVQ